MACQCINMAKSSVHFSNNLPNNIGNAIAANIGLKRANVNLKYLGLPLIIGRSKKLAVADVVERVKARLQGWKANVLSQTARSTLIRTVAQSIPCYTMPTFLIPKSTCESIDDILRRFWWGHKDDKSRNLCLKSWDSLCIPKSKGGLGFRRMWDI